jgi:hypothetical protein
MFMSVVPQPIVKQKNWFVRHKIISGILGVFIVLSIVSLFSDSAPSSPSTSNNISASPTPNAQFEADKKSLATLALVQMSNPNIQQNIIDQPELHVTVKNTTKKSIDGIVIEATFKNNFGDTITNWSNNKIFHGNAQETIPAGGSKSLTWSLIQFSNATKVDTARIVRVHFTDGTDVSDPSYSNN